MDDSRLKGYNGNVTHPTLNMERTYCNSCGRPKGWVSMETSEFIKVHNVIVICELCEEKYNKMGGVPFEKAPVQEITR